MNRKNQRLFGDLKRSHHEWAPMLTPYKPIKPSPDTTGRVLDKNSTAGTRELVHASNMKEDEDGEEA